MVEALFQIAEPGESRVKEACKGRAIGIDLGTTNSLVAVVRAGQPVCLRGETDGESIVPSVVYYGGDGSIVVGREARDRLAPEHPQDTIASVKRFMGRGPGDAEATRKLTPYHFAPAAAGDPVVRFAVAGGARAVTPIEVSAEILKVLRQRAETQLGGALEGAVITVPAYFDDGQRQATRDAGRLAGLEVLRLLNEPTAAALAYGLDKQAQGTFAVFDLGGGTFDISILKLEDGVFEVKATGGDSALGGDDFDRAIALNFLQALGAAEDAGGDRVLVRRVLDAARAAKEALTAAETTTVPLVLPGGAPRILTLSRAEMETLVRPVLERCVGPVRRALPPLADIDPDEVVALGAAVQAEILAGGRETNDVLLLDVVPLSLGLETMGGVVEKLIPRNSTIPCGATQTFTTFADRQTGFDLHVVQGEREMVAECRSLARFNLTGIPPMPAGMARLEVTFLVDADGLLRVSAREQTTGKEAAIEVKPSYGLTDEEVERMLLDSFAHAEEDVKTRLLAEQRIEAERIAAAARAAMADSPELLTEADRAAIATALDALAAAKAGTDHNAIRAAIEALDRAKDFAARRMNRAFESGLRGRSVDAVEAKVAETAAEADLAARVKAHTRGGRGH